MPRTILVTGYTGRLGALVVDALSGQPDTRVRVLVRPSHLQAPHWDPDPAVTVFAGDFDDPASLEPALDGVDAAFLVSPVHPEMQKRELAFAGCAAGTAQPHIVKISGLGTQPDSPVDSGRWHAEIEQGVRALGLEATFLRPFFFMQNLGFQADSVRTQGILRGAVDDAAIAMVDARDIADVAATVLMGGSPIEGEAVSVTGAAAYTYDDVADLMSVAFDRPVTYVRQSLEEAEAALRKSGQPDWHLKILLQFNEAFIEGRGCEVSDTVTRVLNRQPATLETYLEELAAGGATKGADPFPAS